MASENLRVTPHVDPDSDHSVSDLIAWMHNHSRAIIEAELRRLSRRVPTLAPADLNVIDATLDHLSESLILHRLRNAPRDKAPMLRQLFGTAAQDL